MTQIPRSDADRPEAIDGHDLDVQPVDRLGVVPGESDVEIERLLLLVAAPARSAPVSRLLGSATTFLGPNIPFVSGKVGAILSSVSRTSFSLA